MSLFDSLCDALELIEEWEEWKSGDEGGTEGEWPFTGYPWDDLRKIKVDMNVLMLKRCHPVPLFDDADFEWLRAEAQTGEREAAMRFQGGVRRLL